MDCRAACCRSIPTLSGLRMPIPSPSFSPIRTLPSVDALLAAAAQGKWTIHSATCAPGGCCWGSAASCLCEIPAPKTEQGGILVGGGGLSIFADSQLNQGGPLDVFAYGSRQRDDATFVTGEEFFNEVNLQNRTGQNPTT